MSDRCLECGCPAGSNTACLMCERDSMRDHQTELHAEVAVWKASAEQSYQRMNGLLCEEVRLRGALSAAGNALTDIQRTLATPDMGGTYLDRARERAREAKRGVVVALNEGGSKGEPSPGQPLAMAHDSVKRLTAENQELREGLSALLGQYERMWGAFMKASPEGSAQIVMARKLLGTQGEPVEPGRTEAEGTGPVAQRQYLRLIGPLRATARELGYALAVHGSLARDIDLVAVAWTAEAVAPSVLVDALVQAAGGITGEAFFTRDPQGEDDYPRKPHGRLAWSIHIGGGSYIDLSVMGPQPAPAREPRLLRNPPEITSDMVAAQLEDFYALDCPLCTEDRLCSQHREEVAKVLKEGGDG